MIIQNLKVAIRNLMKYKVQTLISVVSIAIGIVTLSLVCSVMTHFRLPSIYSEPYYDRAYKITFKSGDNGEDKSVSPDIIRALKHDGGPACTEQIVVHNGSRMGIIAEFHLPDSTVRKGQIPVNFIDPECVRFIGLRSAVTGEKVKPPKTGEAIIGEKLAKMIFHKSNPIGAVQTRTSNLQSIPVTIVDVYKEPSLFDYFSGETLWFCATDNYDENNFEYFYAPWVYTVLREGYTEQQLLKEINSRIEPLGLEGKLSKIMEDSEVITIRTYHLLAYAIGSLILLAAAIGFISMQIQLLTLRRREISLRFVNGASRMKIFAQLFTEVMLSVTLAIIIAVILGYILQDFFNNNLEMYLNNSDITITNLWHSSLAIGAVLLAVCSLMVWVTLRRIRKSSQGLAASMRSSRNHLFRNVMLGIQITISIVFVCSTFIITNGSKKMLDSCNVPENDALYKECLYLRPIWAENPEALIDEIGHLPELERMIMCGECAAYVNEVGDNPEVSEKFDGRTHFRFCCTTDTAIVSFYGMDVEWFGGNIDRTRCLLIDEKLYSKFREYALIDNNTLSFNIYDRIPTTTLPIAGIIKNIPYDMRGSSIVAIYPDYKMRDGEYALVPKPGKGKALARSVNETIESLEPAIINQMVFNFRDIKNVLPSMVETARTGGWILGIVSLIICAMGIFSTISLDTRARKKEVAIRKVNGAKSKDIYRMFSRVYVILVTISLLIAVPVCVLFNGIVEIAVKEGDKGAALSSWCPILLGVTVVILLIVLIVGWHIRNVMRTNPADIILKE